MNTTCYAHVLRLQFSCTELVIPMNNLLSCCGLVDAKQDSKELSPRPLANALNSYLDEGSNTSKTQNRLKILPRLKTCLDLFKYYDMTWIEF